MDPNQAGNTAMFEYQDLDAAYDVFDAEFASHLNSPYQDDVLLWSQPPSPLQAEDDSKSDDSKATKKSSRTNRYKNYSDAALSRRRAQNRENQRAYRKRKEERIVELQHQLDEMSQKNNLLVRTNSMLRDECRRLRAGQQSQQTIISPISTTAPALLDPSLLQGATSPRSWWSGSSDA